MTGNLIEDSIQLEEKSTFSDRIFNLTCLISAIASALMFFATLIVSFFILEIALYMFQILFYPILFGLIISLFVGISQLLRNRYFSSILATFMSSITTLSLIGFIIFQAIYLHKVYIVPFIFF